MMRSTPFLSTYLTKLSTEIKDNFPVLTSTFTTFPQKRATPITTIFIYKYLSPQANCSSLYLTPHSFNEQIYAKLSNLSVTGRDQTIDKRASA